MTDIRLIDLTLRSSGDNSTRIISVPADVAGGLAIHNAPGDKAYHLTHVASGLLITSGRRPALCQLRRDLLMLDIDWLADAATLAKAPAWHEARAVVKAFLNRTSS